MNWFERHVVQICGFGGPLLTVLLVLTSIGFTWYIRLPNMQYKFVLLSALSCFFSLLASAIGMMWGILQKHLPKWLAVFFVIPVTFPIICLFLYHWEGFDLYTESVLLFSYFPLIVWIIGFCIVALSEDRKAAIPRNIKTTKIIKALQYIVYISIVAALSVSIVSNIVMNNGTYPVKEYSHDSFRDSEPVNFEYFSFECPNKYKDYAWYGVGLHSNSPDIEYTFEKSSILSYSFSWISVYVFSERLDKYQDKFPSLARACIYAYYENSEFGWRKFRIEDLNIQDYNIDSIKAEYATFLLYENSGFYEKNTFWEKVKMVCFEREGDIWVIESSEPEIYSETHDFDRVLQSFEISG
ncbi:MAG: hypothetical protein JW712_00915 [Dehalococcoidales bacterium]|nr:hypothetical protein [Dehalococcoidales bacterium]